MANATKQKQNSKAQSGVVSNGGTAKLSDYRQSPRKVRLVADMIRGKEVAHADRVLAFADKKSAGPMRKLLASAVANVRSHGGSTEGLVIKTIRVDKGLTMHRIMPRARGSAAPIRKMTSNVYLELGIGAAKKGDKSKAKPEAEKKADKPAEKKTPAKKSAAKKVPTKKAEKATK